MKSTSLFWHDVWQYSDGFSRTDQATQTSDESLTLIAVLIGDKDDLSQLHFKPSAHGTFTLHMEKNPPDYKLKVDKLVLIVRVEKDKKIGS